MTRPYGFLDWAGDPGFKFGLGSSSHLVLCWVSTEDYMGLREGLCGLRERLGLPRAFEFHFAHTSNMARAAFFAALPALPWEAAVLVVDKRALPREFTRMEVPVFYGHFLGHLAVLPPLSMLAVKRLLVDETRGRSGLVLGMRMAMSPVLRARGLACTPEVYGQPAHRWDGLQVADMLAGAVVERESGGKDYLKQLRRLWIYRYQEDN